MNTPTPKKPARFATNDAVMDALGLREQIRHAKHVTLTLRPGELPVLRVTQYLPGTDGGQPAVVRRRFKVEAIDEQPITTSPLDLTAMCDQAMQRINRQIAFHAQWHLNEMRGAA